MAHRGGWLTSPSKMQWLEHAARTTVAAVVSVEAARVFGLPEVYWPAISALVVMQSTLRASLPVSVQRFCGDGLGAACGGLMATYSSSSAPAFGAGIFFLGLICPALKLDRSGYRFAGISFTIVMLVERTGPAWRIALQRFAGLSIGIVVGLVISALWPERQSPEAPAVVLRHPPD